MEMNMKNVIEDCATGSDEGRFSFPQVVTKLTEVGVERYLADLQRGEKTFYAPGGESCLVSTRAVATAPASNFCAVGVEAAICEIQAGEISYEIFCEQIAKAGCVGYIVSLLGRQAVYFGRSADIYVEPFPAHRDRH